jgi:two-component system sensor histidine kinase RegB
MSPAVSAGRAAVGLPWLVRLRWGVIAFQLLVVALASRFFHTEMPSAAVLACIAAAAVSNLLVAQWLRRGGGAAEVTSGIVLAFDIVLFTGVLHLTGGPWNPFTIVYLVYITLGAVVLGSRWTWSLATLAVLGYATLFLLSVSATDHTHLHGDGVSQHLQGMWVAFASAAVLTTYFVVRLTAALERRDAEIVIVREQAARNERLASLTTLAAGAAHELGSPLATIAVVASELERALARLPAPQADALVADARLIRSELQRCRRILDSMAAEAGQATGEVPVHMAVEELVRATLDTLPPNDAARVIVGSAPSATVKVPPRALVQALAGLVRNALDATRPGERVELSVVVEERSLRLIVHDEGTGMPAEVLARAGEPFFSTKPAGRGLGLGLFLTRALAEQMGGRLALASTPGAGATAEIALPASVLTSPAAHG